jgi:diaminopimelate decarboxylase
VTSDHEVAPESGARLASTWLGGVDLKRISDHVGTPVFIYSEEQLLRNLQRITSAAAAAGLADRVQLYIPFFPNSNPHVLRPTQKVGAGLLLQVPGEYEILSRFGYDNFIISPGHVSDEEIAFWAKTGYTTFLSSLDEVAYALQAGAASISARIDSLGSQKPGIKMTELRRLSELLTRHGCQLECFEVYCGSGNSRDAMIGVIETMFTIFRKYFPDAQSINFAGGYGFAYDKWAESEKHFAWADYFAQLRAAADRMHIPDQVRFLFEPARDVLADTGALLVGVKRDLITNPVASVLVTDGSRMLMPSAQLRDRRHNVAFLDAGLTEIADSGRGGVPAAVRGRTILRHDYILPAEYLVPEGVNSHSYLLILDAGVYCATQHMEFLNVPPAPEVLVDLGGELHMVSSRGDDLDKWRNLLPDRQPLRR